MSMPDDFSELARGCVTPTAFYSLLSAAFDELNAVLEGIECPARFSGEQKDLTFKIMQDGKDIMVLTHRPEIGSVYSTNEPNQFSAGYKIPSSALTDIRNKILKTLGRDWTGHLAKIKIDADQDTFVNKILLGAQADPWIAMQSGLQSLTAEFNKNLLAGNGGCQFAILPGKETLTVYRFPERGPESVVVTVTPQSWPNAYRMTGKNAPTMNQTYEETIKFAYERIYGALDERGRDAVARAMPLPKP